MSDYKDYGFQTGAPAHTFVYLQAPILSLLNKQTNRTILDLGCGNGYLANFLVNQGFNVYGTDASEEGIAIAKQAKTERFFIQDISTGELPVELQEIQFDTIISTEVIEHLYDPAGFVAFCRKLLPKGGELLVSTPYHGYFKNLMLALFNKWDHHHSPGWHGGHIKFWSRRTLSDLVEKQGFRVTHFVGCGRMPFFWKSMIIKARLS
jgi:2-polyprenyl-3-methyl-5-hydroxy-6-metoxy-1,4-benzoquinol methylase